MIKFLKYKFIIFTIPKTKILLKVKKKKKKMMIYVN